MFLSINGFTYGCVCWLVEPNFAIMSVDDTLRFLERSSI